MCTDQESPPTGVAVVGVIASVGAVGTALVSVEIVSVSVSGHKTNTHEPFHTVRAQLHTMHCYYALEYP
jgi:hypothetical protein